MIALMDTSFLLATVFAKDINHVSARNAMRDIHDTRYLVAPVVFETFYMVTSRLNYTRAVQFFGLLQSPAFKIIDLTAEDMERMQMIMSDYTDNAFDLADVAQMAVAERLNITRIYTFDKRDFGVFRPKHTQYLELVP
jgi:predicted nucleic acid-binding protein